MSPSIPVYSRDEIEAQFSQFIKSSNGGNVCELKELVQNQCTFDGNRIFCLPFKRLFLRCLDESVGDEVIGYKLTPSHKVNSTSSISSTINERKRWRNIEITKNNDNQYDLKSGAVKEFIKADEILLRQMEKYYNNYKS